MAFDEHALELSIIDMFEDEHYTHVKGESINREDDTEVLLLDDIIAYLQERYEAEDLTENEIQSILLKLKSYTGSIYEANKAFMKDLCDGFVFHREDNSKKDIFVEMINFGEPAKNTFKIVNQLEITGSKGQTRIPDGIVYVNGLPLIVLEFKNAIKENTTIYNAYTQLTVRYKRDIPELFKYNAFVVISDGVNSKYGSLFTPYEYFYAWRKVNAEDQEAEGINSLITMIKGLFARERLVAVIKDFIYFPDSSSTNLKIVCRYPQFFAATKLFKNILLRRRPYGNGKGGTYFGATGSGKSYTMLYLTRLLMKSLDLASPTIILITDRTDLDDQLSKQFVVSKKFIGDEIVENIESRANLHDKLHGRTSGGVYLTTIQKFTEELALLSNRSNIICISDEAHRSQINLEQKTKITEDEIKKSFGFAKYLHDSLPNATYVGFSGTPIDGTIDVFGPIVDQYTMTESVRDGITVNLVYDGRAAKVTLDKDKVKEIEEYYKQCETLGATREQIETSQRAVAHIDTIIGDPDRLRLVAEDFVKHYETRVKEGATVVGKALFVCANREIAYNLYKIVISLRPEWAAQRICADGIVLTGKEKRELKPIEMVKLVMTRNKDDEKELYDMLGTDEDRKEFARQFKDVKSNFKIAIVVDMWLTGFDVPALDTIYIDKPLQKHTLIQTVSRVNRVYEGKEKGLIVDYIGIKKNMNAALRQYSGSKSDSFDGVEQSVQIVKDQLELLDAMFHNFDSSDYFKGTPKEQLQCLNRAVEFVQQTEERQNRFMEIAKKMKQAYNLCSTSEDITIQERERIHFYVAVRSILFKLTKGNAPDVGQMTDHVKKLVEQAIQADGIELLFESGHHIEFDIFSDAYLEKIEKIQLPNTKIKLLQSLLKQAINEYKKVNRIKSVEFAKRLKKLVDSYNNRSADEEFASQVLEDVANGLEDLMKEIKADKESFKEMNISYEEKAFYDILLDVAKRHGFTYPTDKMIELAKKIKIIVEDAEQYPDWLNREDIRAKLRIDLKIVMHEFGYPPIGIPDVSKDIFAQTDNYKKNLEE